MNEEIRKLVKRMEDVLKESSAFKPYLLPQLNGLAVLVSKGVDFAIQVGCFTFLFVATI